MKILVADDHPVTRRRLEKSLTDRGYAVVLAGTGHEALEVLGSHEAPSLAIVDWQMPGLDGLDVCRRIRESDPLRYVYVIMLTGKNTKQDLLEAMHAGADDYMTKPFDFDELVMRVRAGERVLKLQEELRNLSMRDHLTGLLNRGTILEILNRELAQVRRGVKPASVILADIDHFKSVNDTYGHQVGDGVLVETGKRMLDRLRPYDALGRYGGEEFLIVLPSCDVAAATEVAERVRQNVGESPIITSAGDLRVSVSLGVASFDEGAANVDAVILAADKALYSAKALGRDRVVSAT